jgi:protease-4
MNKILHAFCALTLLSLATGCTLFRVSLGDETLPLVERVLSGEGRDKVLLLEISGFLTSEDSSSVLSSRKKPGSLALLREELDRARTDKSIKALVLRISSPGGGVTASDLLHHELTKFKKDTGLPILAHLMDTAASGAYYAAVAADRITAQPTCVTGSIGVIMLRLDATGLMEKIGLRSYEITSGEKKGMGSPLRQLSPEERTLFQAVVNSLQERFVNTVAEGRKMPLEAVQKLADGRIFTSSEALASGLIDAIAYLDESMEQVKKMARLDKALVVTYSRPGEYRSNLYSMNLITIDAGSMLQPGSGFLYLWWP